MGAQLRFEHFAINVKDPVAMAEWYCANLGMQVVRRGDPPGNMHFLADAAGTVVVEIYCSLPDHVPDYASMHPLLLHLAFDVEDAQAVHDQLVAAGAISVSGGITTNDAGDRMAMLRDPWGFCLQLCQRVEPMVR